MYTILTTTRGRGALGNQEWYFNPRGTEAGDLYEVRFRDVPIEWMGSYLVYPFYLINSANLDISMTMRKTKETPPAQQLLTKLNQLKVLFAHLRQPYP